MKKLLLILIIEGVFFINANSQSKLGNNPGNIINGGLIASDSISIYFVGTDAKQGMYSKRLNGTNLKKLTDGYVEYLNIFNGWLYYRAARSGTNSNDGGLYKMRTDGSEKQRLTSDEAFYINVIGDYVYYVNWSYSTDICRIKTDGTDHKILFQGNYQCLTTDGNYLYFGKQAGPGTSLLFRGALDGSALKQMLTDTIDNFFVYENYIYYRKHFSKIYRINKNSLKTELLFSDENLDSDFIIPYKDLLYLGGLDGIQEYNIPEKKFKKLYSGRIIELGLAANYIYFTTATWDKNYDRHTSTHLMPLDDLKVLKHVKK